MSLADAAAVFQMVGTAFTAGAAIFAARSAGAAVRAARIARVSQRNNDATTSRANRAELEAYLRSDDASGNEYLVVANRSKEHAARDVEIRIGELTKYEAALDPYARAELSLALPPPRLTTDGLQVREPSNLREHTPGNYNASERRQAILKGDVTFFDDLSVGRWQHDLEVTETVVLEETGLKRYYNARLHGAPRFVDEGAHAGSTSRASLAWAVLRGRMRAVEQ